MPSQSVAQLLLIYLLVTLVGLIPLIAQTIYWKNDYKAELKTGVDTVRVCAGLSTAPWTNSSLSGAWIKAVDISELRPALGDAINLLGLPAPNLTDSTLAGAITTIKKAHIEEMRQSVK